MPGLGRDGRQRDGHFIQMRAPTSTSTPPASWPSRPLAALANAGHDGVDDIDQFVLPPGQPADHRERGARRWTSRTRRSSSTSRSTATLRRIGADGAGRGVAAGQIKPGDKLLMAAFGAGYTAGAAVVEWTADPARAFLAPGDADAPGQAAGRRARAGAGRADVRPDRQGGAGHRRSRGLGRAIAIALPGRAPTWRVNYRGNAGSRG